MVCIKLGWKKKQQAIRGRERTMRIYRNRPDQHKLQVYKCLRHGCRMYHLTSKTKDQYKREQEERINKTKELN